MVSSYRPYVLGYEPYGGRAAAAAVGEKGGEKRVGEKIIIVAQKSLLFTV
jgi:hypothetical protein